MIDARRNLGAALIACSILGGGTALAGDPYTAGFYTRGADTVLYLDRGDSIYDPVYFPIGPLVFVPRATLSASYEDNLFLDANNETSGFVVMFAPGASLIWGRSQGNHVTLDGGALINVYDSSDELDDDLSYFVTLSTAYSMPKTQMGAHLGYRRLENADTVVGARIVKQDYVAGVAVDYRLSGKTAVGAIANAERHEFDADRFVDYDRYYGALRLYYDTTPRSQTFLQVGAGKDDLDTDADGFADAEYYDVSVGARGRFTPKSTLSGRVGYQWRTFDDVILEDIEHWTASLRGEVTPFSFTTWFADLAADIRPAIADAGSSSIDQRLRVGAARRLGSERVRGSASVLVGRVDYRSPRQNPDLTSDEFGLIYDRRRDEYWGFSLGVDWWTRHNLSWGVAYDYIENNAAQGAGEDTRRAARYNAGRWTARVSWNY